MEKLKLPSALILANPEAKFATVLRGGTVYIHPDDKDRPYIPVGTLLPHLGKLWQKAESSWVPLCDITPEEEAAMLSGMQGH